MGLRILSKSEKSVLGTLPGWNIAKGICRQGDMDSSSFLENTAALGSDNYYDMVVRLYIRADSTENGRSG